MQDDTSFNRKKPYINANKGALAMLLAIIADLVLVQFLFAYIAMALSGNSQGLDFYANIILAVCIQIVFISVTIIFLRKNKLVYSPRPKDKSRNRIKSLTLHSAIGILGVIVCLTFFSAITVVFDLFITDLGYIVSEGSFLTADKPAEIIAIIFLTVVYAPIGEELIFRGLLLSGMKKSGFKDMTCVLLSGIAFSLMHMNPSQTVYQFFLGCALALITIKSNSLIPAMIMHAANNFFAVILDVLKITVLDNMLSWIFSTTWLAYVMPYLFAAVGIIIIFFLGKLCEKVVKRFHGSEDYHLEEEPESSPQFAFASPYQQPPYGQTQGNPYQQPPYGQTQGNPYQQPPYGQTQGNPYQQPPYGQTQGNPYQQPPYGQTQGNPYQQPPYGQTQGNPYQQPPYGQTQGNPYQQAYGQTQDNPYQQPYGNANYYGYQFNPFLTNPNNNYYKKRDEKGKGNFKVYYIISVGICATLWLLVFFTTVLAASFL